MKAKLIVNDVGKFFERELNHFIKDKNKDIKDIKFTVSNYYKYALIFYEEPEQEQEI